MAKTFLDGLIILEEITSELDVYDLPSDERAEILGLIHHTTHQHILNVILNHLPREHHENFSDQIPVLSGRPGIISFPQKEIKADIESEIRIQAKKSKPKS